MLYSCTHMATVGVKGLTAYYIAILQQIWCTFCCTCLFLVATAAGQAEWGARPHRGRDPPGVRRQDRVNRWGEQTTQDRCRRAEGTSQSGAGTSQGRGRCRGEGKGRRDGGSTQAVGGSDFCFPCPFSVITELAYADHSPFFRTELALV